ncbi:LysR substrate-binding domain-containing protein [Sinorhizobium sp. NFACC03]|uniref:LysR substrate-binding domain-containing protein n=1 Tax=Sinorhizobium sp. NFACC03 TaxID=1566295 RepID=UPI000A40DA5C|nr:LysR substrate-binding domain-containing protein [Sinorhizobium sp. NFACC03]
MSPFLEIGSREGVWKAVERGLGIGVVADFEFVSHPRLRTIRIADCSVRTEYRLAGLQERRSSRKINAFLDAVL